MPEVSAPTLHEPRPRVLLIWAIVAACLLAVAFSLIEQPKVVHDNFRWVWEQTPDVLEDNLFRGGLAALVVLFGGVALRRSRAGQPMPWKDVGLTVLVGPGMLLLGALVVGDGSPLGLVVFLIPIAQLVWSVVRVIRRPEARLPLVAGFLLSLWVTLGLFGVALGLYTGFGRTWR